MNAVIVDTNVIITANDEADHASPDCVERCQKRIKQILDQQEISLVDDGWRILNEYKRYVNLKTRKGIGDLFVKTLLQNLMRRPAICTMVHINPLDGSKADFEEFPTTEALNDFDVADRKFIAVAIAYERDENKKATILQALDRKWEPFREIFEQEDVQIDFLCPSENET
ncbi:hypothetical protein F4Z99_17850 [Candidatus Poribacteria bacterium]|nr:hypothetical protein [Candidatus Poribacteria bacterium]